MAFLSKYHLSPEKLEDLRIYKEQFSSMANLGENDIKKIFKGTDPEVPLEEYRSDLLYGKMVFRFRKTGMTPDPVQFYKEITCNNRLLLLDHYGLWSPYIDELMEFLAWTKNDHPLAVHRHDLWEVYNTTTAIEFWYAVDDGVRDEMVQEWNKKYPSV